MRTADPARMTYEEALVRLPTSSPARTRRRRETGCWGRSDSYEHERAERMDANRLRCRTRTACPHPRRANPACPPTSPDRPQCSVARAAGTFPGSRPFTTCSASDRPDGCRSCRERKNAATPRIVARADQSPGTYELVAIFDALHNMDDPVAVGRHVHASLPPGRHRMLFEPAAGDQITDNLNPVGRRCQPPVARKRSSPPSAF